MQHSEMKIGQLVRVTATNGGLFASDYEGQTGRVTEFDQDHVTVKFDDDEEDYGRFRDITLVQDVAVAPTTVKEAIANVELALGALKALVG